MKKLIVGIILSAGLITSCSFLPKPAPPVTTCSACDLYTNPETVRICKAKYCALPTAQPTKTGTPNVTPIPTVVPTSIPTPTVETPLNPPTIQVLNGCHADDPHSVGPNGVCEFNLIFKVAINNPSFTPPCDPSQCPSLWRPSGMALACDHMFTDPNVPAGVFEPKIGKWVSIMYYVCAGRIWDFPGKDEVQIVPTSGTVNWKSRTQRNDPYNGTIAGHGTYLVCVSNPAHYCLNAGDYDLQSTYGVGASCPNGEGFLPNAPACTGPFTVNR